MNQTQRRTISNIVRRLKNTNIGCSVGGPMDPEKINKAIELLNNNGYVVASRLYVNSWVIPALELTLETGAHNHKLAESISKP